MSNWNQLGERLRSWTPRAPSPSVRARLFGAAPSPAATADEWAGRPASWHWLAPAMAVFLLGMFVVGRGPAGFDVAGGTPWAVSAIGHPQLAAYSATTHHSEANSPPVTMLESTFAWTNDGPSLKAPASKGQTNGLMQ